MREEKPEKDFIREKIVRPKKTVKQLIVRAAFYLVFALVFGAVAAVGFVVARQFTEQRINPVETEPAETFHIAQSSTEAEETTEAPPTEAPSVEAEVIHEAVGDELAAVMKNYEFTDENLASLDKARRKAAQNAAKGFLTVVSGSNETDLFGNPVEQNGEYVGAIVAQSARELRILTFDDAVNDRDSLYVILPDSTMVEAREEASDSLTGLCVLAVEVPGGTENLAGRIQTAALGNTNVIRTGDPVISLGNAGQTSQSVTFGSIAAVSGLQPVTDGLTRYLYADITDGSAGGSFFVNYSGELLGWSVEGAEYYPGTALTQVRCLSDYEGILEKLANGIAPAYMGITAMDMTGSIPENVPKGVYVSDTVIGGPAYEAGIQNGDILTLWGDEPVASVRDLMKKIGEAEPGTETELTVMRQGRDDYAEIRFLVNIGKR